MAIVHQSEYQQATAGRHRDHALPPAHEQAQVELDRMRAIQAKEEAAAALTAASAAEALAQAAATDAAAAQADADAALAQLADISSDDLITPVEKPPVMVDVERINDEKNGIDAQADAYSVSRTAYDTAVSALNTYLATLTTPVAWNNLGGNTTVVGSTFRQKFTDLYDARQVLLNAISAAAKVLADAAQGDATQALADAAAAAAAASAAQDAADAAQTDADAANSLLADIASDSKLTPDEKPAVIKEWGEINGEQSGIDASATNFGLSHTAYDTAVTALATYLGGLTPQWDDLGVTTNIVGATFRQKFLDVYSARQTLLNAIAAAAKTLADAAQSTADAAASAAASAGAAAEAAQTDASQALSELTDIASDSILSPVEKPRVVADRDAITGEQSGIDAQATAFGVSHSAYDAAVTALTTYLATLTSPVAWDNFTGNTTIVGSTFRQKFLDVYAARQTVLNAIYGAAKALADAAQADADAAASDATSALNQLNEIASDNKVTPAEKLAVLRDWRYLDAEQAQLDAQADLYAVSRTTYDTKIQALRDYMETDLLLELGVTDEAVWLASTATITGSTFRLRFKEAYDAEVALVKAIVDATKPVVGARLSAGLTNFSNLFPNPTSEIAPPATYTPPGDGTDPEFDFRYQAGTGNAYSGAYVRRLIRTTPGTTRLKLRISASPGDYYYLRSFHKWISTGGTPSAESKAEWLDASGGSLNSLTSGHSTSHVTWTDSGRIFPPVVAPANTAYAELSVALTTESAGTAEIQFDAFRAAAMVMQDDLPLIPPLATTIGITARARSGSGQSLAHGNWTTFIPGSKDWDLFNTLSGTGVFTCPSDATIGKYRVSAGFVIDGQGDLEDVLVAVYKNGVEWARLARVQMTSGNLVGVGGTCLVNLASGDAVDVRIYVSTTSHFASALEANATSNWIEIHQVFGLKYFAGDG